MTKKKLTYHARILNLLSDGVYHTLAEIVQEIARHVDPTAADAQYQRSHPGWKQVKQATRIADGKKRLSFLSLNTAIHNRKLVEAGSGRAMDRKYRLRKAALRARRNGQPQPETPTTSQEVKAE